MPGKGRGLCAVRVAWLHVCKPPRCDGLVWACFLAAPACRFASTPLPRDCPPPPHSLRHVSGMQVIKPLCLAIESDLRLHVHTVLLAGSETPNPKTAGAGKSKALVHLIDIPVFTLMQVLWVAARPAACVRWSSVVLKGGRRWGGGANFT